MNLIKREEPKVALVAVLYDDEALAVEEAVHANKRTGEKFSDVEVNGVRLRVRHYRVDFGYILEKLCTMGSTNELPVKLELYGEKL